LYNDDDDDDVDVLLIIDFMQYNSFNPETDNLEADTLEI
jgi:hypothetical protein